MGFENRLKDIYDLDCVFDQPMKKKTSLGVGGNAKYFASPKSLYALNSVVETARECKVKYKVIGYGTNILVSDGGFDGLIVSTVNLSDVFFSKNSVLAMCGAPLKKVVEFATENSLTGLEPLVGIPATIGGAIYQNAGAFGATVSDCVTEIQSVKRGKIIKRYKEDCRFRYRKSIFCGKKETIVSATFSLKKGVPSEISERCARYIEKRKNLQPTGKSCGSVFLNGSGVPSGKLIEEAGLKGFSIGGATVSTKHANFITVNSSATAKDVYELIRYIKKKIKDEFSVELKEEAEFVGEF